MLLYISLSCLFILLLIMSMYKKPIKSGVFDTKPPNKANLSTKAKRLVHEGGLCSEVPLYILHNNMLLLLPLPPFLRPFSLDNFYDYEKHFTVMNYQKGVELKQVYIILYNTHERSHDLLHLSHDH